jgi:hypothetical protein
MAEPAPKGSDHYLDPKPTIDIFTLPCGFVDDDGKLHRKVQLREMTGIEEEVLAGKGEVTARLNRVISNCITALGEDGLKGELFIVKRLTVVDRVFLLIALRRVSLGDDYGLKIKCPACSHQSDFKIDLGELEVIEMDDPAKREYDGEMPSGLAFKWHPMTGVDEDWLAAAKKKLKGEGAVTLAMLARLDELDGELLKKDPKQRKDLVTSVTALAKLSIRDRNHLRRTFTKTEGNVDTELEFECDSCSHEFHADLRVDPAAFFFPSEM